MIVLKEIALSYGAHVLYENVNHRLLSGQRIALVGANGAGKSTLLDIITSKVQPSHGTVEIAKDKSIGLLSQDHFHFEDDLVLEVVMQGKPRLFSALKEKAALLRQKEITHEEGYRLAELEEIITHENGYLAEAEAEKILIGLGVSAEQHILFLKELSGGWKFRVLLAQALFKNPDILLLDEPTNHLDITSINWLSSYLQEQFSGLLIFVSHDRSFIDEVATEILDIDFNTILLYPGNYEKFLADKEQLLIQAGHQRKHQEQRIQSLQSYVDRFRAKASKAKQAKSRIKMIDRIQSQLVKVEQSTRRQPYFDFKQKQHSGKTVLTVKEISKQFDHKSVLNSISFNLMRGDRCAVIGPNGVGKSTLLKTVLGKIVADSGHYAWNETATIGYFAQDYQNSLQPEASLLNWLTSEVASVTEQEARQSLGKMLFSSDAVQKRIEFLSGGESARLIFAKLLLQQNNVLVLDEPTNHLDLESIDALAEGLLKYPGTLLFVSHNRYFVELVATSLLVITAQGVDYYPGNYQDYLARQGVDYLFHD